MAIALELRTTPEDVRDRLIALGMQPNTRTAAVDPVDYVLARLERPAHGCWLWQGQMSGKHPVVSLNATQLMVGRLLWEHFVAPPPPELHRTCAEPRCVRPSHREAGPAPRMRARRG